VSTPLTCHACRKPIEQDVETAAPHVRLAMVDPTGHPIKGSFRAYHVACAPWWADNHLARTGEPE